MPQKGAANTIRQRANSSHIMDGTHLHIFTLFGSRTESNFVHLWFHCVAQRLLLLRLRQNCCRVYQHAAL